MTMQVFSQNTLTYLEIKVFSGNVGAHFSWYCGQDKIKIGDHWWPTGHSCFNKIVYQDDANSRTYAPNSWIVNDQPIGSHDIYILDLSDWDGASAYVKVVINGKLEFEGSGSADHIEQWSNITLGDNVRITDDREIAFDFN